MDINFVNLLRGDCPADNFIYVLPIRISLAIRARGLYKEPEIPGYEWTVFPYHSKAGIFFCAPGIKSDTFHN